MATDLKDIRETVKADRDAWFETQQEANTDMLCVSGKVWEALGAAWADSGSFNNAIGAYRRSLRAKSANASLVAMEQLGNLLVRRAQQVWAQARTGAVEAALKAGQEALVGSTSNVLLNRQMQRQTRAAELKGPKVCYGPCKLV